MKFGEIKDKLTKYHQEHLLDFYDGLAENQKNDLLKQIDQLDLDKIAVWIEKYVVNQPKNTMNGQLTPANYYKNQPKSEKNKIFYNKCEKIGENLIAAGKVAAFTVAGGQGTRLGFDGPKGNYPTSPIKKKTLFQIFAEIIKATNKKYNAVCPWYIMTSKLNYEQTVSIFKSANYFGLEKNNVFIFKQGTLPNFGFDGKILLADKNTIACSPDGHGGSLKALYQSGAIQDMQSRNIEQISYFQIDNPLINILDPLFIGLHANNNAEMSSKALIKTNPMEKVGNFCFVDGKMTVIEYSDLSDEQAERKQPDGSLLFQLGSIAIHIISRKFVEKLNDSGDFSLELHRAEKKIPHINATGNLIKPTKPNGVKLESFVFDALPLATNSVIFETIREQEFAPIKNPSGIDSIETAHKMITGRNANWLKAAGIAVPKTSNGEIDCTIEIAPSFALTPSDVKQKVKNVPQIFSGDKIYLE